MNDRIPDPPMPRFPDPDDDPGWRGNEMARCRTCWREMTREELWEHTGAHDSPLHQEPR